MALAVGLAAAQAWAQSEAPATATAPAPATCVEVKLVNVLEGKGSVRVVVWGSAETFFKTPVWARKVKADTAVLQVPVCGLDLKEIAISVYQDVNDNGKMDTNPLGIPTEPYGASGTPGVFGPPTWNATKVALTADQKIEIRL